MGKRLESDSCISWSHLPPGSISFLIFHEEGEDGYLVISFVAGFFLSVLRRRKEGVSPSFLVGSEATAPSSVKASLQHQR